MSALLRRLFKRPVESWEPGWCMVLGWTDAKPVGPCCAGRRRV